MESGVEFICADFPTANRLTIHIIAAVAEHEAAMISSRTKAGLQAAKNRGVKLGKPKAPAKARKGRVTQSQNADRNATENSISRMRGWSIDGLHPKNRV